MSLHTTLFQTLEISFLRDILGWAMPSWTAGMGEKMSGAVGAAKTKVAQSFSHQNLAEAAKADPATNGGSETSATSAAAPANSQPIPEEK